jgi:hypothetical protein
MQEDGSLTILLSGSGEQRDFFRWRKRGVPEIPAMVRPPLPQLAAVMLNDKIAQFDSWWNNA